MKALTLYQPWASLIAKRVKTIETRSWGTNYRGRIAIHAGLDRKAGICAFSSESFQKACVAAGVDLGVPRGVIVCTAELWHCWQVGNGTCPVRFSVNERHLGNIDPGRWLWFLRNVCPLHPPVPCRGARGLFDVPDELVGA